MAYLTSAEYVTITGRTAPSDFATLEAQAERTVDDLTLYGYVGRSIADLPTLVQDRLKAAVAFQVLMLDDVGLDGANEAPVSSASIGKFSYSGAGAGAHDGVAQITRSHIPFLVAYMRGVLKSEANT